MLFQDLFERNEWNRSLAFMRPVDRSEKPGLTEMSRWCLAQWRAEPGGTMGVLKLAIACRAGPRRWYLCGELRCGGNEVAVKLTLTPVIVAAVYAVAGCTSTAETAATAHPAAAPTHPTPAPTLSPLTRAFGAVLTLPVVKSSPVG
jgi:hypothetical protein